jgi:YidC/Oxa1 family membrane protein insertase
MAKALTYGLPGLTLLFTWWLPAAVQISFFVSGLLSFAQASMFKSPVFRNYFGMTPLPSTNNPTAPPSPYKGTMKLAASAPAPASGANATPKSSPVLSTSELNSRFEASSVSNESTSPPRSKLLSKLLNPINEARDSARGVMKKANESMDGRREKNEIAEKRKYELKRQEELRKERWERENERRAERAAKKARGSAKKA